MKRVSPCCDFLFPQLNTLCKYVHISLYLPSPPIGWQWTLCIEVVELLVQVEGVGLSHLSLSTTWNWCMLWKHMWDDRWHFIRLSPSSYILKF
jgi:hypothetical protein